VAFLPGQNSTDFEKHVPWLESFRAGQGNDDNIKGRCRQLPLKMTEKLPQTTFDAVTLHGIPEALLNHHAQAVRGESVLQIIDPKVTGSTTFALVLDAAEFHGMPHLFVDLQTK
jgi:hypothetical protein